MDNFDTEIQCEEVNYGLLAQFFGLASALIPEDELKKIFFEFKENLGINN